MSNWLGRAHDKVNKFASEPEYTYTQRRLAKEILNHLYNLNYKPQKIVPTAGGGISIYLKTKPRVVIVIDEEDSLELLIVTKEKMIEVSSTKEAAELAVKEANG